MITLAVLLCALNAEAPEAERPVEPPRPIHVITINLWELIGTSIGIEYEQAVVPWVSVAVELSPRFQPPGEWGFRGFFGGAVRASIRAYPFGRAPWGLSLGAAFAAGGTFESGQEGTSSDGTFYENKALAIVSAGAVNAGWSWCFWNHFAVNVAGGVVFPFYDEVQSSSGVTTGPVYLRPDIRIAVGGAF